MTALITLSDNIFAPNGEEYRAMWGEIHPVNIGISVGDVTIPEHAYLSMIPCPRPQSDNSTFTDTKDGKLYHEPRIYEDFKHIYYAD